MGSPLLSSCVVSLVRMVGCRVLFFLFLVRYLALGFPTTSIQAPMLWASVSVSPNCIYAQNFEQAAFPYRSECIFGIVRRA